MGLAVNQERALQEQSTKQDAVNSTAPRPRHIIGKIVLWFWLGMTAVWIGSFLASWQFTLQTTSGERAMVYLIRGALYYQSRPAPKTPAAHAFHLFIGNLPYGRLLAPATGLLIKTNGGMTVGGDIVDLHGLVWSSSPSLGVGLILTPLSLALLLLGPLAWWLVRRRSRRSSPDTNVPNA